MAPAVRNHTDKYSARVSPMHNSTPELDARCSEVMALSDLGNTYKCQGLRASPTILSHANAAPTLTRAEMSRLSSVLLSRYKEADPLDAGCKE